MRSPFRFDVKVAPLIRARASRTSTPLATSKRSTALSGRSGLNESDGEPATTGGPESTLAPLSTGAPPGGTIRGGVSARLTGTGGGRLRAWRGWFRRGREHFADRIGEILFALYGGRQLRFAHLGNGPQAVLMSLRVGLFDDLAQEGSLAWAARVGEAHQVERDQRIVQRQEWRNELLEGIVVVVTELR